MFVRLLLVLTKISGIRGARNVHDGSDLHLIKLLASGGPESNIN